MVYNQHSVSLIMVTRHRSPGRVLKGRLKLDKRYIQLYSLGGAMQQDFLGSLKRVAEIGFTGVEFAGGFYGGLTASELKAKLAELGLEPLSSHIPLNDVSGHLDYAAELGLRYIIVPMESFETYEQALALAKRLNEVGEACAARGIVLGYHNHRHEFLESPDGTLLETLIKNTCPDKVVFQLDVGWATCSGINCPEFIKKYAGRFALIHVKECAKVAGPEKMFNFGSLEIGENGRPIFPPELLAKFKEQNSWNVPSGEGIVDWPAVRDAALAQGAKAFIIEREFDYKGDIFACVTEDCAYLKSL